MRAFVRTAFVRKPGGRDGCTRREAGATGYRSGVADGILGQMVDHQMTAGVERADESR